MGAVKRRHDGGKHGDGLLYTNGVDLRPSIHIMPRKAGRRVRFGASHWGISVAGYEHDREQVTEAMGFQEVSSYLHRIIWGKRGKSHSFLGRWTP